EETTPPVTMTNFVRLLIAHLLSGNYRVVWSGRLVWPTRAETSVRARDVPPWTDREDAASHFCLTHAARHSRCIEAYVKGATPPLRCDKCPDPGAPRRAEVGRRRALP